MEWGEVLMEGQTLVQLDSPFLYFFNQVAITFQYSKAARTGEEYGQIAH